MKLKDKEAWLELYEVAENIQKLEPWKYLWDMDLLMYLSEEMNDIFYCSVLGHIYELKGKHKKPNTESFIELVKYNNFIYNKADELVIWTICPKIIKTYRE